MKKVSKEELIEILKNKDDFTYKELSQITGYHPKYLIRLNKQLQSINYNFVKKKKGKAAYSNTLKENIINDYLNGRYRSYKEFYNKNKNSYKNDFSYSLLCKILSNIKTNDEILIIMKVKNNKNTCFFAIDYQTESLLFTQKSEQNDVKSFKKLFYYTLSNYGNPEKICFVNCFNTINNEILDILETYKVENTLYKSVYRKVINNSLSKKEKNQLSDLKYSECKINEEDFYNSIIRKTISDNLIQFENNRYLIKTFTTIKKNKPVTLFYNDEKEGLYIKYKTVKYKIVKIQNPININRKFPKI